MLYVPVQLLCLLELLSYPSSIYTLLILKKNTKDMDICDYINSLLFQQIFIELLFYARHCATNGNKTI